MLTGNAENVFEEGDRERERDIGGEAREISCG